MTSFCTLLSKLCVVCNIHFKWYMTCVPLSNTSVSNSADNSVTSVRALLEHFESLASSSSADKEALSDQPIKRVRFQDNKMLANQKNPAVLSRKRVRDSLRREPRRESWPLSLRYGDSRKPLPMESRVPLLREPGVKKLYGRRSSISKAPDVAAHNSGYRKIYGRSPKAQKPNLKPNIPTITKTKKQDVIKQKPKRDPYVSDREVQEGFILIRTS